MQSASNSSATPDTRSALQILVERYQDFPDHRIDNNNKKHPLVSILVSAICAALGGANSWLAVQRFGIAHQAWLRSFLDLPHGIPSHDTYRLVFLCLDPEELNLRFANWIVDINECLNLKQIAIDGKTLCGSGGGRTGLPALRMVHAFAIDNGICLGQVAVDVESNEITAIPDLRKLLDLKGSLVTMEAMGCQKTIAADIVRAKGDYILAVKGNQERLHEDVQQAMAAVFADPGATPTETVARTDEQNRGRNEKRTCYVSTDLSKIRDKKLWEGIKTIGAIVSERIIDGRREVETRYYICSRVLTARTLLQSVRDHWKIENPLHWVLDVVFGEDGHQLRVGNGPRNFTTLRKLAHALIANHKSKYGIKGTREMAGWNTDFLEEILRQAAEFPRKPNA